MELEQPDKETILNIGPDWNMKLERPQLAIEIV